jgi:hypothetical protein
MHGTKPYGGRTRKSLRSCVDSPPPAWAGYGAAVIGLQQRRAARNEAFFRDVNEQAAAARTTSGPRFRRDPGTQRFVCECADADCLETLLVAGDEYREVRASPHRFIVVPGHEIAAFERVVDRRDGYLVVEKHEDANGDG